MQEQKWKYRHVTVVVQCIINYSEKVLILVFNGVWLNGLFTYSLGGRLIN